MWFQDGVRGLLAMVSCCTTAFNLDIFFLGTSNDFDGVFSRFSWLCLFGRNLFFFKIRLEKVIVQLTSLLIML